MRKNNLLTLLDTFLSVEMRSFSEYLHSPYFNKKHTLAQAFDTIRKNYRLLQTGNHEGKGKLKLRMFDLLYPGQKFNEARLRNLYSQIHKKAVDFIKQEALASSQSVGLRSLLASLNKRHLVNEWEEHIRKSEQEVKLDCSYFLDRYFIQTYKFNFSYLNKKIRKLGGVEEEIGYLNDSISSLVYFFVMEYITSFLTYTTYMNNYNLLPANYKFYSLMQDGIIKNLISSIDKNDKNYCLIKLYSKALDLSSSGKSYKQIVSYKELLMKSLDKLSRDEINFHIMNLISYLMINLSDDKNNKLGNELLNVYKFMLDQEYYLHSSMNHLPHEIYRSILLHALSLKQFKWGHDFVIKYSKKVHPNDIRNMECFGFAYLSYYEKRYSEALKHLNEIEVNHFQYKMDVKNLALRLYFELGYFEESLSFVKSYREFLKYDKTLSLEKKLHYKNFIKYYEKMVLLSSSFAQDKLEFLKYDLEKNNEVSFKSWLLEKLTVLISKK